MPKVLEHKEAGMRRIVRDALAIDPLITVSGLQRALEQKTGRPVGEVYTKKLLRKVQREVAVNVSVESVEKRIAEIRETNRIVKEELLRIAFPSATTLAQDRPSVTDRRKALESIARIEATQAKLEMDFGLFTRKLGEIGVDHRLKPLDDQTLATMMTAWKMWFAMPIQMRKYEPPKQIKVETPIIPNAAPNTPTTPNSAQPAPAIKLIPAVTGSGLVATE